MTIIYHLSHDVCGIALFCNCNTTRSDSLSLIDSFYPTGIPERRVKKDLWLIRQSNNGYQRVPIRERKLDAVSKHELSARQILFREVCTYRGCVIGYTFLKMFRTHLPRISVWISENQEFFRHDQCIFWCEKKVENWFWKWGRVGFSYRSNQVTIGREGKCNFMATSAPASFQSFMGTNGVQKLIPVPSSTAFAEALAKSKAQTDEKLQIARLPTCL